MPKTKEKVEIKLSKLITNLLSKKIELKKISPEIDDHMDKNLPCFVIMGGQCTAKSATASRILGCVQTEVSSWTQPRILLAVADFAVLCPPIITKQGKFLSMWSSISGEIFLSSVFLESKLVMSLGSFEEEELDFDLSFLSLGSGAVLVFTLTLISTFSSVFGMIDVFFSKMCLLMCLNVRTTSVRSALLYAQSKAQQIKKSFFRNSKSIE